MNKTIAFVGDIHGCINQLESLIHEVDAFGIQNLVFLGDYINRGPNPRRVLETVFELQDRGIATPLAGNHELALIEAIDTKDITKILKMGGATTIRSYVGKRVGEDVLADFTEAIPSDHITRIRNMPTVWNSDQVVAIHNPSLISTSKFIIGAHSYVGKKPVIRENGAQIDTGCGSADTGGRLTALIWPTLQIIQVDNDGRVFTAETAR